VVACVPSDVIDVPPYVADIENPAEPTSQSAWTMTRVPDATGVCVHVRLVTPAPPMPLADGPTASKVTAMTGRLGYWLKMRSHTSGVDVATLAVANR
jgi:hypothetical protein